MGLGVWVQKLGLHRFGLKVYSMFEIGSFSCTISRNLPFGYTKPPRRPTNPGTRDQDFQNLNGKFEAAKNSRFRVWGLITTRRKLQY